jgi:hypothetical protein
MIEYDDLPCMQPGPMPDICPACGATADDSGCMIDKPRTVTLNATDEISRLTARVAELEARVEQLGEQADTCVGNDIGRRCSYCRCDGRNLRAALEAGGGSV